MTDLESYIVGIPAAVGFVYGFLTGGSITETVDDVRARIAESKSSKEVRREYRSAYSRHMRNTHGRGMLFGVAGFVAGAVVVGLLRLVA